MEIADASVLNSDTLSVQTNAVLAGTTTMTERGGITFNNHEPGNSATIEHLSGGGGLLHFTVDPGTGATDFYIVEKSEGNHLLAIDATGGLGKDPIDLVKDVSDGAVYDLDETYTESGAALAQNNLISRLEGGARIWSLGRKAAGLTRTAAGVGNAPAISLVQADVGMAELGRHFRDLREPERQADGSPDSDIWANSYIYHLSVSAMGDATMNMRGLDIGFDKRFDGFWGGSLYLGLVAGGQWISKPRLSTSSAARQRCGTTVRASASPSGRTSTSRTTSPCPRTHVTNTAESAVT